MMLDDIKADEISKHIKRSSVEPWIENVGETGCLEPASSRTPMMMMSEVYT